ncbi:MAG TPA: NAD(P)/FAD-dependent oxidoreductase [Terracidiphilus sp.]|nr:NAD(P)/FAD-dependent oxidoreductase [Terracidiphilus sp.]
MAPTGKTTPYKQAQLSDSWDAIVIGSGIGGLTAAAMLSVHGGRRALVLERHYVAGGFTHSFHRPGYDWDVGLHYIGQVQDPRSPVRRAFDHLTAGAVEWAAMPDVYDRIVIDGRTFDFAAGMEHLRDGLKEYFPREARAIDKYLRAVRAVNRLAALYYAEKVIPAPAAAIAGSLLRAPYLRWARRTTLEVLQGLTTNRELIGVLTAQWGDYGLPPAESSFAIHATIVEHYFAGASYPVGGASTIAAAIVPQIERSGGAVVTSAEVAEILLSDDRAIGVRMADGREFRAGMVVSDAGATNTFNRLLPADTSTVESLRAELRALPTSSAHLSLYVGLDATAEALGLTGTNLWIYPGYDHDENVRRFAADPAAPFSAVYISFPSAKDPEFLRRHPGKSTIEVITMLPYGPFARWGNERWKQRGPEYEQLKQQFAARLLDELQRQVPQVAGHIQHAELSTPVTTRHFMNYEKGEIYGIAATPARFAVRALSARTPIRNLYLTGQDVASLGVVGALYGGVISASVALGKNLMGAIAKPLPG